MSYSPGPGSRLPVPRGRRSASRRQQQIARRRALAALVVVGAIVVAWLAWPSSGASNRATAPPTAPASLVGSKHATGPSLPSDVPIKHVIFIVKENRTFNNYFATYPGATGAARGGTISCDAHGCTDGAVVRLKHAKDVQPHDLTHCFRCGLTAIDGGKMNGFNQMGGTIDVGDNADLYGKDLSGYVYFDRDGIPNYWRYADRFVLADRFFTSMYGPTLPAHLYAVAAQSNGIVENKGTVTHPGSYCDDPTEFTSRFPSHLSDGQQRQIMDAERRIALSASGWYDVSSTWRRLRLCFDIEVLPDQLTKAGISWGYYAEVNAWQNALQMIRHVRNGPEWKNVRDPEGFLKDVRRGTLPDVSWVIPSEPYNEHP